MLADLRCPGRPDREKQLDLSLDVHDKNKAVCTGSRQLLSSNRYDIGLIHDCVSVSVEVFVDTSHAECRQEESAPTE